MAESPISPITFERDLRADHVPWKRSKDHAVKWSRGARPSPGVRANLITGQATTGSDRQKELCRPLSKPNSAYFKREHNLVKLRDQWDMPNRRVRDKIYAQKEINDPANISSSLGDIMSAPTSPVAARRGMSSSAAASDNNVLYSFDRLDTPGLPVTLDIFVKTTGRDTEKLVEKEYEVINTNGESLTGRKARRDLRKGHHHHHSDPGPPPEENIVEDEGFELL